MPRLDGLVLISEMRILGPTANARTNPTSILQDTCVSFESKNNPGDFLRHQNSALHVQPFDGTALNRSDATFCPQPGKDGKGNSFHAVNYPTKYIRHYYGKVYIASDGDGTNPWDTTAHWSDDVSFVVSPAWSP